MALLKQKQVSGLTTDLAAKIETASNQGAGQGLFKQATGTDLEFYTLGGEGIAVGAPASDLITLSVDVADVTATKSTGAVAGDFVLIQDSEDTNTTKRISVSNLLETVEANLELADFTAESATQSTDNIIFFDDSDTDNVKVQTKAQFLVDYAPLASPALTGTPTAPTASAGTNNTQIATTAFVTTAVSNAADGLDSKDSVRALSDSNINLASATDPNPIDGVTLANGDRVLLTGQSDASENGPYDAVDATDPTTWVRTEDADEDSEVTANMYMFIEEGTTYGDTGWVLTTNDPITLDTTALTFSQFNGAANITAGDGLDKTGNVLSVNVDDTSIEIVTDTLQIDSTWPGQTSITTLGTIGTGTWQGTEVDVPYGGTGLTTVAAHSILISQGVADTLVAEAVADATLIGRNGGNITDLGAADVQAVAEARVVKDEGTLTNGSMTLGTLSQTPHNVNEVDVYINGLLLEDQTDYTISGTTVTATNALNISYGGSAGDGNGFENDDRFQAVYEY